MSQTITELTGDSHAGVIYDQDSSVCLFWRPHEAESRAANEAFEAFVDGWEGSELAFGRCDGNQFSAVAASFNGQGFPSLIVFDDCEEVGRITGEITRETIEALVRDKLKI